jgi:histidinol-phosphatase (PHP family)
MVDYHVHPDFSHDAEGAVEEFCARATAVGLSEICFTTHYEPDPFRSAIEHIRVNGAARPVASDWPAAYLAALNAAAAKFPALTVLAGVEVGYEPGLEGMISDFLNRYRFDFVLGSVHCLGHIAITAGDEMERFTRELLPLGPEHFAESYLRSIRAAAGAQLFDCLGHLDIYRKYVQPLFGQGLEPLVDSSWPAVLESVAATGTGIEVNTSALRRGNSEPYPGRRLLRRALEAGVKVFTVGSDAHRPGDLGRDLDAAVQLLSELGVRPARFRGRQLIGAA